MTSEKLTIEILRYDPGCDRQPRWCSYTVGQDGKITVLGALLYLQEEVDPTLAFRYGCRYDHCGLCAVEVNGRPRMACSTYLQDGMRIGPLGKLPVIRDLVTDRQGFFLSLAKHALYLDGEVPTGAPVRENEAGARLRACTECLSCLAACPRYEYGNPSFGGPYLFVKLAQLHFDPRDRRDRRRQAAELGIGQCRDCEGGCFCPHGIAIRRDAVGSLQPGQGR